MVGRRGNTLTKGQHRVHLTHVYCSQHAQGWLVLHVAQGHPLTPLQLGYTTRVTGLMHCLPACLAVVLVLAAGAIWRCLSA